MCQNYSNPNVGSFWDMVYITFCTVVRGGPSHDHRQHLQKILCSLDVFFNTCKQTDPQTDIQSQYTLHLSQEAQSKKSHATVHNYNICQGKYNNSIINMKLAIIKMQKRCPWLTANLSTIMLTVKQHLAQLNSTAYFQDLGQSLRHLGLNMTSICAWRY